MAEHAAHDAMSPAADLKRGLIIGAIAFLTLVDLFAAQAILPSLVESFGVSPSAMGAAVNASTFGMAAASLGIALISRKVSRRHGVWVALLLLAIPTTLLATTHDLMTFTALRVVQGVCMATAFTLTMAYLAEECTPVQAAGALAAYVTGNVASNLFGRLLSANVVEFWGVSESFYVFAGLNVLGAALAFFAIHPSMRRPSSGAPKRPVLDIWRAHLTTQGLPAAFAIGFLILFVFLGVFTYVNFVLAQAPFALGPAERGLVYFVFLPALITTPLAGGLSRRWGARQAVWAGVAAAGVGVILTLSSALPLMLAGLALIGAGTFFAQAAATGFVSGAAREDRAAASGLYLAAYYVGGLVGGVALGEVFDRFGWVGVAMVAGAALLLIALVALRLTPACLVAEARGALGPSVPARSA